MMLKKVHANYTLSITKCNGSKETTTVSFYSSKSENQLMHEFSRRLHATYDSPCEVELVLWHRQKKIGHKQQFKYHNFNLPLIKVKLLKVLCDLDNTIDVKNTRFQITIQNTASAQLDSKAFTFNSELRLIDLLKVVKSNMQQQIEVAKNSNMMQFANRKISKTTHYITIISAGTLERRKLPSKTFSVYIPDYSSNELLNLLKGGENNE